MFKTWLRRSRYGDVIVGPCPSLFTYYTMVVAPHPVLGRRRSDRLFCFRTLDLRCLDRDGRDIGPCFLQSILYHHNAALWSTHCACSSC